MHHVSCLLEIELSYEVFICYFVASLNPAYFSSVTVARELSGLIMHGYLHDSFEIMQFCLVNTDVDPCAYCMLHGNLEYSRI